MSIGVAAPSTSSTEELQDPLVWKLAKFGVVGVVATVVHLSVAWMLLVPLGGLVANAAGFVAGLSVTYLGNYFATFKSQAAHGPTLVRFLVVSAATLAVSEWALVALHAMRVDERVGLVIAIVLLPLLRFGLLAKQVFVPSGGRASLVEWLTTVAVWSVSVGVGILALWVIAPPQFLDPTSPLRIDESSGVHESDPGVLARWYGPVENWRSPMPRADDLIEEGTTDGADAYGIPLFAMVAEAGEPLGGDDIDYLPAWFLLAFSAVGPSGVALLRGLGVRRPAALLGGAALAVALPALTFRTLHPALSGQFLPLLVVAATLRIGRTEAGLLWPLVAVLALVVTTLVHPFLVASTIPLLVVGHAFRSRRQISP